MNKVSEYLRGDNPLGDEYAAAIERLVQAAEKIVRNDRKAVADLERMGITDNDTSLTDELDAALKAFREASDD